MTRFPDVVVPRLKTERVYPEQKMKDGIQQMAGFGRSGEVGRFQSNDAQPDKGRKPRFPKLIAGSVQSAKFQPQLFHRIVRRLAGNHHIMHVALA